MNGLLRPKQRAFIEAYLVTWNASEAARRAGYRGDANTVGPRLLANVGIQAAIQARLKEMAMGADEVLVRMTEQARTNIGEFFTYDEAGQATGIDWDMVKNRGHLVKSITWGRFGPKLELHDGQAALVHLGKHLGLFKEQIEHSGRIDVIGIEIVKPEMNE